MTADVDNLSITKNIGTAQGLLESLVPQANCFYFYDAQRRRIWCSDGGDDYEIDNFVTDLPSDTLDVSDADTRSLEKTLSSGRELLLLPVHSSAKETFGFMVIVFSRNDADSSSLEPGLLENVLLPVANMIGETSYLAQQLLETQAKLEDTESELQLVYRVDKKIHDTSRSHVGLAQLIGQSARFLDIAYSVLLLPGKRIRISATNSSWRAIDRRAVDKYLVDKLFPQIEGKREPWVISIPPTERPVQLAEQEYQAMLSPLLNNEGKLEGAIAQFARINGEPFTDTDKRFMTHIMRKVEYVIDQSFDVMTGFLNRSGFEAQLIESGKDFAGEHDSHQIIYIDLDNLHLVNDTFGRDAGDRILVRFAQMLDKILPRNAVGSRLTGDNFAVLLTNSSVDDAVALAELFREKGKTLRLPTGERSLQVTFSSGIATFDRKSRDHGNALTTARIACDAAKAHGRDRLEVYDSSDKSIIRRYDDMHLITRIQQVLDEEEFTLVAQPIVSLAAGDHKKRYEILLRMRDGEGTEISSTALFSAAERYQFMPQIDRWVVSTTLRKLGAHADYLRNSGTVFAINLSGQTLGGDGLLKFVEDEIDANGVPESSICFEVTESAAVSNHRKAQIFIDALRERGCQFSLDDFGAGLSSFAYLKNFRVDTLKIDGSFVRDIVRNPISESMVSAITEVAKVMGLKTVAEYVETDEARALVRRLGVDYVQGHATGRPVNFDGLLLDLTTNAKTA